MKHYRLFTLLLIGLLVIILNTCENSKKNYEYYNENDFYEVQGVVTYVVISPKLFDSPRSRTVFYNYHLDFGNPLSGKEESIDLVININDPIVVLVYKKDIKISFFGRYGIIN